MMPVVVMTHKRQENRSREGGKGNEISGGE